jgi:hypothetical protein
MLIGDAHTSTSAGVVVVVTHISKISLYLIPSFAIYELRRKVHVLPRSPNNLTRVNIIKPKVAQKLTANQPDNNLLTVWAVISDITHIEWNW